MQSCGLIPLKPHNLSAATGISHATSDFLFATSFTSVVSPKITSHSNGLLLVTTLSLEKWAFA